MERVEASVQAFVTEHPGANYRDIVTRFGTPQNIVLSWLEEMEPGEVLDGMRLRQKILLVVAATAAVLALMRFTFLATAYFDHAKDMNGYAVVEIIEINETTYEEEH